MHPLIKELSAHPHVQIALGVVGVILLGSLSYYLIESRPPTLAYVAATEGSIAQTITGTGTVSPIENPELSFATGGRVTYVRAQVGQKVSAGTVLATLDTGVLSASLASAQAQLDKLVAGPRDVDLAGKQTSLQSASQAQTDALTSAQGNAELAVALTNPLFLDAGTTPKLQGILVNGYDSTLSINAERRALNQELDLWRKNPSHDAGVTSAHLHSVATYLDHLITIVSAAKGKDSSEQATLASWLVNVNTAHTSVENLITTLSQSQLSVQAAQDQLTLTQAGSPAEDIAAQRAQVAGIAAQLRGLEVIAPFDGTVASVSVKSGDVLAPNTVAVSLIPEGTFEVQLYVSEIEMTKMTEGDAVDVTLDAYGSSRVFPAKVGLIDRAPSLQSGKGASGYKITVIFDQADPSVTVGMHANAVIHGGSKDQTLVIPRTALIDDGTQTYVLKKTEQGPVKTLVTIGLISADSAEVLGGLTVGDQVARVGTR